MASGSNIDPNTLTAIAAGLLAHVQSQASSGNSSPPATTSQSAGPQPNR